MVIIIFLYSNLNLKNLPSTILYRASKFEEENDSQKYSTKSTLVKEKKTGVMLLPQYLPLATSNG